MRWKQRLLAEGNDPSYWDILPFETRVKILGMASYQKHREQWAKVMVALMSFGSCCCSRKRDCEEHHPRNVLVNWHYKVRLLFCCLCVLAWRGCDCMFFGCRCGSKYERMQSGMKECGVELSLAWCWAVGEGGVGFLWSG